MSVTRRRDFLRAGAAAALAASTAAPASAALNYQKPPSWDALVRAANQEGAIVLYIPEGDEYEAALVTRFQRAFPAIKVQSAINSGAGQSRLIVERSAGRYIPDIWVQGSTTVRWRRWIRSSSCPKCSTAPRGCRTSCGGTMRKSR
jgi:hypothetical protein